MMETRLVEGRAVNWAFAAIGIGISAASLACAVIAVMNSGMTYEDPSLTWNHAVGAVAFCGLGFLFGLGVLIWASVP